MSIRDNNIDIWFNRNYTPFEASQPNVNETSSYYDPNAQYSGGMFTPVDAGKYYNDGGEGGEFDNEPPLLEGQSMNTQFQ